MVFHHKALSDLHLGVIVYARVFDISALSNVGVLLKLHDAIPMWYFLGGREFLPISPLNLPCVGMAVASLDNTQSNSSRLGVQGCYVFSSSSIFLLERSPPLVLHHKALPTCIWGRCLCQSI